MGRVQISKKICFEVFKRDSFTCQCCGASAPNVILNVDHLKPAATGGDNEITNLVTSCSTCNSGKGPREVNADAVIARQHSQLEELNERRLQLEMLLEWREELQGLNGRQIDVIASTFEMLT